MCFKMHLEALNPLAHLATPNQAERFLRPIAQGQLFMSVAANEPATGRPMQSLARPVEGGFLVDKAEKAFVTSSRNSHLFQFTANHEPEAASPTAFVVERDKMECTVQGEWDGLGMRGNDSCHVTFSGTIPSANVVGELGGMAQIRRFHLPFVFLTYAAVYLGIAEGAFEEAKRHVTARTFSPLGRSLAQVETIQRYFGEMKVSIDRTRALVYAAAGLADRGAINDLTSFQSASVAADETALEVTHTAMIVGGGTSYAKRNSLERYLRDARAGVVMVPQDDVVKLTLGRTVLGV
ncbi:MAG: acyl-CoA dehydrogenase [Dehalococcoidia bacterium]|nr:acyl-CoA dehydrogenase [Dehalococcoidia bacterium]